MSSKEKVSQSLEDIESRIDALETFLQPFLQQPLAKTLEELGPLEGAKVQVSVAYFQMRLQGGVSGNHPIHKDLDRVKGYLHKVKQGETYFSRKEQVRVNADAAGRFIRNALGKGPTDETMNLLLFCQMARGSSSGKKKKGSPSKVKGRVKIIKDSPKRRPPYTPKPSQTTIAYVGTLDPEANAHLKDYVPPSDRPVRVYSDGIYDMFHYGHARALEQVKKLFPNVHLIVGVCNDALTYSMKGRTVMDGNERTESLRHCRWVDEVVEDAPWVIDEEFIKRHQIDFVAHDDIPYASEDSDDVYSFVKKQGKFIATQRTAGISTSDLITRIVRDYDSYVRRNLQRGATPRDLNLSFLKQGEIKMEQLRGKLQKRLREEELNIKNNWESTRDELVNMLQQWESKSQELIQDFSNLFDVRKYLESISPPRRREGGRPSFRRKLLAAFTGKEEEQ